jgi:DNA-binding transcriptional MerR regulator
MPRRELMLHPASGQRMTLEALATEAGLHPNPVERFVAYGLVEPVSVEVGPEAPEGRSESGTYFHVTAVRRLRTIRRLREDLGINLPGIAVVLDLLKRIEALQREVTNLRQRISKGSQ